MIRDGESLDCAPKLRSRGCGEGALDLQDFGNHITFNTFQNWDLRSGRLVFPACTSELLFEASGHQWHGSVWKTVAGRSYYLLSSFHGVGACVMCLFAEALKALICTNYLIHLIFDNTKVPVCTLFQLIVEVLNR